MKKCRSGAYAYDPKSELVHVLKGNKTTVYHCPHCEGVLQIRQSARGKVYFAHVSGERKQTHDFTIHQMLCETIMNMLKVATIPCTAEYVLGNHRADILLKIDGCYTVIEIQRTPITLQEITNRYRYYQWRNIRLIWILCVDAFPIVKIARYQQYLLALDMDVLLYNTNNQHFYTIKSGYKITNTKICCDGYVIDFITYLQAIHDKTLMLTAPHNTRNKQWHHQFFYQFLVEWQQRMDYFRRKRDPLTHTLYTSQTQLTTIPITIYQPMLSMLGFYEHVFWIQTLLYLYIIIEKYSLDVCIGFCKKHQLFLLETVGVQDVVRYYQFLQKWQKQQMIGTNKTVGINKFK